MERKSLITLMLVLIVCMALVMVLAGCNADMPNGNADNPSIDKDTSGGDNTSDGEDQGGDVEEHTHVWGDWALVTAPTETKVGNLVRSCECGEFENFELPVLNEDNYIIEVLLEVSCTNKGLKKVTLKNDKVEFAIEIGEPELGHDYGEWTIDTAPTCTAVGKRHKECSRCNEKIVEEMPMAEHNYIDEVIAPTCSSQGYTLHTCSVCGNSYKDNYLPQSDNHVQVPNSNHCQCGHVMDDSIFTFELLPNDSYTIKKYNGAYSDVVIPSTYNDRPVVCIEGKAFSACNSLTRITIPNSITTIRDFAFDDCNALSIYVEASAKPAEWSAYWNSKMYPVIWDANNNTVADDGYTYILYNGMRYALKDNNAIVTVQSNNIEGDITIPKLVKQGDNEYQVTEIKEKAFSKCSLLTSITIQDGVTSIGSNAFVGCSSLKNITLSSTVASIGARAFNGCSSLENITLPNGINSIGNNAFVGCSALRSIMIPDSVVTMGEFVFDNCKQLVIYVHVQEKPAGWDRTWKDRSPVIWNAKEYATNSDFEYAIKNDNTVTIVRYIGTSTTIEVPSQLNNMNVTSIFDDAFARANLLTSITIPNSVTKIGDSVFMHCTSLTSITLSNGITSIPYYSFSGCTSLTSVTIPSGVTIIGEDAFSNCGALTSISLPQGVQRIDTCAFLECKLLNSIILPSSITSIKDNAFVKCDSLVIYAKGTVQPETWSANWNRDNRPVYWYSESQPTGTPATGTGYWHYDADGVTPAVWSI